MHSALKTAIEELLTRWGVILCLAAAAEGVRRRWSRARAPFAEPIGRFFEAFLPKAGILIAGCAALFAADQLWFRNHPLLIEPATIERAIVEQQLSRAKTVSTANVIVIGDSSALMDVDAPELGRMLGGRSVENLSTLGWVGARGYAHVLQLYFERGQAADAVVLLMHGASLDRPEGLGWDAWEDAVLRDSSFRMAAPHFADGLRSLLNDGPLGQALALPLPGAWGRFFGTRYDVERTLRLERGCLYEPVWEKPDGTPIPRPFEAVGPSYRLSPSGERDLRQFAEVVARLPVARVLFGVTPSPRPGSDGRVQEDRRRLLVGAESVLRGPLGTRLRLLDLNARYPESAFATETHMNKAGRAAFTEDLSRLVAADL